MAFHFHAHILYSFSWHLSYQRLMIIKPHFMIVMVPNYHKGEYHFKPTDGYLILEWKKAVSQNVQLQRGM